jgi:hypothetical protein
VTEHIIDPEVALHYKEHLACASRLNFFVAKDVSRYYAWSEFCYVNLSQTTWVPEILRRPATSDG